MAISTALPTAQKPMSAALWGLLLLLGAIWGGAFFFVSIAVAEIQPLTLVLLPRRHRRAPAANLAAHPRAVLCHGAAGGRIVLRPRAAQ